MARSIRNFTQTLNTKSLPLIRIRSNRYVQVSLVVLAVLSLACLHIWQRVRVMTLVHETALLRQENRQLVDARTKLDDDIALLSAASRIERYATDTLNLIPVPVDRLFTVVPENEPERPVDELSQMFSSIKRVASAFPTITESRATAGELPTLLAEPADSGETDQ
jgi:hypothetical protein